MIITQQMEHGWDYLPKDNQVNQSNYRKIVSFDSDLIISLLVRKLNKMKFNKFLIKSRACHAKAQQLIYILFIHVIILSVRIARRIFLQLIKFVKFVKNNLKPYYHNLKLNDIYLS